MKVTAKDSNGRTIEYEAPNLGKDELELLSSESYTRKQIKRIIDNMNVSADAKSILSSIADTVILVGEKIIQIGKKIIEYVLALIKAYPNATFGLVLGLLLGALVTGIPIIGVALGALINPLLAALGLAAGWMDDLRDNNLKIKIVEAQKSFSALAA